MRPRRFRSLLVLVLLLVGPASAARGQDLVLAQRAPRFLLTEKSGRPPVEVAVTGTALLQRVVSLTLARSTTGALLDAIERQTGVQFGYSPDLLPSDRLVTLRADSITVGAALVAILMDLGVDVMMAPGGKVALVKRRAALPTRQSGQVTGRVMTDSTGAGVANAEVALANTRWHTLTDTAGRYRLADVDAGTYTLTVRRIGYAKQSRSVTVREGQTDTVDIALASQATRLDELVTTATGQRRRRDVPHDITRLDVDSIMQTQPIRSVTDVLEGRVPGLSVQRTSGAPGDPSRLRLRGASSPNLNNDPIVLVDGIRMYSAQSDARNTNLADHSYAAPSPLDQIDPNSIETIEVIKDASATTLYGQDAANGVIVITTKKGKAGPTRWNMAFDHGATEMAGQYPERVLRWGHTPDYGFLIACPLGLNTGARACDADSIVRFQLLNEPDLTPFGTGRRTEATLGVSGGVRQLTYSVTGSYSHEVGLLRLPDLEIARYEARLGRTPPDWMRRPQAYTRWGVVSTLGAQLGPTADLGLSVGFSQGDQQRSELDKQLGDLDATYFDRASGRYYFTDGLDLDFFGSRTNLLDNYYTKVTEANTRLTTGAHLNWRLRPWLSTQADAGVEVGQRGATSFLPRSVSSGVSDSLGRLSDGQGRTLTQTLALKAIATPSIGGGFNLELATGVDYFSEAIRDVREVITTNLQPGKEVPGDSVLGVPQRLQSDRATFGWFVQPTLRRGNVTLISGVRLDGGNTYGGGVPLPALPKLGGTWTISDEPFFPFRTLFSSLRIRAAYGWASRQPGPADRLRLYGSTQQVPIDGQSLPITELQTLGNTQLRPERTRGVDGGIEADFLDSRVFLNVTAYRRTTTDALLTTPLPPSIGLGSLVRNIGVVRNTGLDVELIAQLVRSAPVKWTTDIRISQRRDEVIGLAPGVEPFGIEGNGTQRVVPGYPLFGFWVRPVVGYGDLDGDGLIERGEVAIGDTAIYRGSPLPDYQATFSSSLSLWQGALQLTALLTRDQGNTQQLSRNLIARQVGLSAGRNDPASSPAEQALVASTPVILAESGTDYYWLQQVSTTRLNAVSVTYNVPRTLARRVGAERLSLSLQGNNLRLWSDYRGFDPNVNGAPTGNLTVDSGQLPQPRTWQLRIAATY